MSIERLTQFSQVPLPASGDLSALAKTLEQDGGVTVFSVRTRDERGQIIKQLLVLKYDHGDSVDALRDYNKPKDSKRGSSTILVKDRSLD